MKIEEKFIIDKIHPNTNNNKNDIKELIYELKENGPLSVGEPTNKNLIKRIIKKILFKSIGWILNPLLDKQNEINKKIIDCLEILENYNENSD